jgi:hypothetical protein
MGEFKTAPTVRHLLMATFQTRSVRQATGSRTSFRCRSEVRRT